MQIKNYRDEVLNALLRNEQEMIKSEPETQS
jgi:hypothetical protein